MGKQKTGKRKSGDDGGDDALDILDDPAQSLKALLDFEKALEGIPDEMKPEYVEASKALSPDLIRKEADPVAFLRREGLDNAWAAALRFVMYWKARKQAFGNNDGAFLRPLSLDPRASGGSTAFGQEEIQQLASGYAMVLPPDPAGRPVLYIDASQIQLPPAATRMKHLFYVCQEMSRIRAAQKSGLVCVFLVSQGCLNELESFWKEPLDRIAKALPIRLHKCYFVPREKGSDSLDRASVERAIESFGDTAMSVFGDGKTGLTAKLQSLGLSPDALPPAVGGTWTHDHFFDWLVGKGLPDSRKPLAVSRSSSASDKKGSVNGRPRMTVLEEVNISDITQALPSKELIARYLSGPPRDAQQGLPPEALERIPNDKLIDYLDAKKRVPVLVEHESPFSRFLACTNGDRMAAAERLAEYWRVRKHVYGDRACLPLNMSGQGALTEEDMSPLFGGCLVILPCDRMGRPVVCLDMTRAKDVYGGSRAARIWFYLLQVASENAKSQSDGIVFLYIHQRAGGVAVAAPPGVDDFISTLPVRLSMVHKFRFVEARGWTSNAPDYSVPSKLPFIGHIERERISVHPVDADHKVLARLDAYGMEKLGLPISIGGGWDSSSDLEFWINHRNTKEKEALSKLLENHADGIYGSDESDSAEEMGADQEDLELPWVFSALESFSETPEIMAKGLSEMKEALSSLEDCEKIALVQASETAPEVVERETPMIRFLRFENYNAWAAARRLALYWRIRKDVYGPRAFLPMNLSGEGTLTREEVIAMSAGYNVLLPYDKRGRSVMCYDLARIQDRSLDTRVRISFYLVHVVSENPMSQLQGIQVLIILRTTKPDQATQKVMNRVLDANPMKILTMHVMNCPYDSERTTFLETLVPIWLRVLGVIMKTSNILVAGTKEELMGKLSKYDFVPEGVPECLGGTWSYDMFSQWLELRTRFEWSLPPVGPKNALMPHVPEYSVKPRSQLTEDEKVERKRRLNVLNSRRKRERVRVEVAVFSEQVNQLRRQNLQLRSENERLEECLEAARAEVVRVERQRANSIGILSHSVPQQTYPSHHPQLQEVLQQRMIESMLRDQARSSMFLDHRVLPGTILPHPHYFGGSPPSGGRPLVTVSMFNGLGGYGVPPLTDQRRYGLSVSDALRPTNTSASTSPSTRKKARKSNNGAHN